MSDPTEKLLGHSKIESTARYLGVNIEDALTLTLN
jgi:hypothetical protein